MSEDRILTGTHIMSGNQAIAEGALSAGLQGYFGYPITPSTSIMEHVVKRMAKIEDRIAFVQMEDEIASISAVIGCSWTRRKAMSATSGPGFSLMQEGIGLASFTETPLVLVNVMRGGPSTGLPTFPGQQEVMQAHFGSHGDYIIPTLVPSSIQECYDFTIEAFNIAEALRTPVFILSDQILSTLKEKLVIPDKNELEIIDRAGPTTPAVIYKGLEISSFLVPPHNAFGEDLKSFGTGLAHDATGHVDLSADNYELLQARLFNKINKHAHLFPQPKTYNIDDADLVLIAFGSTARACRRAAILAQKEGLKVGVFVIKTLWPFPEEQIRELVGSKAVLVVEMSKGQLIWPVERYLRREVHHLAHVRGQIPHPSLILDRSRQILGGAE
ncbi:MAG: 2-oxoacid:acceptor oxidoreductase subunit alpha [Candidatus Heimdallarchaeota archaeon]|nr:2-oxoacid:acceptor oxidoreductase subunit alpha [Candidatus Heimdallarchaeota archaeon]